MFFISSDICNVTKYFITTLTDSSRIEDQHNNSSANARFYSGSVCNAGDCIEEKGKRGIGKDKVRNRKLPFYCWGHFYMFTMNVAKDIAVECVHHCINFDPKDHQKNRDKYCFYILEDVFIGPCIEYTQKYRTKDRTVSFNNFNAFG